MDAPAGVTDVMMRDYMQTRVDSDLAHILTENGVPLPLQYNITQEFPNVRRFGALADTRANVRTMLRDIMGIAEDNLVKRAAVAAVVVSWEAAKEYAAKDISLRAEARLLGVNRPVTQTDRAAFIRTNGEIEEAFEPSDDYLSAKMEEQESHEPAASPLSEVTSKKTSKTLGIQTSVDSQGVVRIVKQKQKGQLPQGTEELRTVLRIEGNTWCYLAAKYRNKPMMQNITPAMWLKYANYLLGEKCYLMKIPNVKRGGVSALDLSETNLDLEGSSEAGLVDAGSPSDKCSKCSKRGHVAANLLGSTVFLNHSLALGTSMSLHLCGVVFNLQTTEKNEFTTVSLTQVSDSFSYLAEYTQNEVVGLYKFDTPP